MKPSPCAPSDASRFQYIRMNRSVREAMRILAQPNVDAVVVIDANRDEDGAVIGILTERDVFRALARGGLEVLDGLVWMLANDDFACVDRETSPAARLRQFCDHRTDHIAVMDGSAVGAIQSIWDCVGHLSPGAAVGGPRPGSRLA